MKFITTEVSYNSTELEAQIEDLTYLVNEGVYLGRSLSLVGSSLVELGEW